MLVICDGCAGTVSTDYALAVRKPYGTLHYCSTCLDRYPDLAEDSCPGCGCVPGEGLTPGCTDSNGCGFWRKYEQEVAG